MKVMVINGPNLNWLGRREPKVYGSMSLAEINCRLADSFPQVALEFFQANGEGEIVSALQLADDECDGVIINPAAFGHYSLAIADALAALSVPVVEVHLTNVFAREAIRHQHVTAGSCRGYICGLGWRGYRLALEYLMDILEEED